MRWPPPRLLPLMSLGLKLFDDFVRRPRGLGLRRLQKMLVRVLEDDFLDGR